MLEVTDSVLAWRSATVWVPRVSAELLRLVRTSEIVSLARARTRLTSPIRSMVRRCRSSSSELAGLKAESTRAPMEGSVTSPGWTLRSMVGTSKSLASTTRLSSAEELRIGGASSAAHWTVVPSAPRPRTPLVTLVPVPWWSVTTRSALRSPSEVDPVTVSGEPTRAACWRAVPAASYVSISGLTVRFCTVTSIEMRPV